MLEKWKVMIISKDTTHEELQELFVRFGDMQSPSTISAPSLKLYWLYAFIRNYGSSRQLAITVVEHKGRVKLIMPLQIKEEKRLEFLCDETSDYNDFFFHEIEPDALKVALKYWVSKGFREIKLDRFPKDSQTLVLLRTIVDDLKWEMSISYLDIIPIIDVESDQMIQNWRGVKPERVKKYQRKLMDLRRNSDVTFSLILTEAQLRDEFPAIKNMHITRWNGIGSSSKYADPRREAFIFNICEDALKDNSLFMPIMKINGILASYIIGFKYNRVIFDWNTSFSLDFQRTSPGMLLLLQVLSNPLTYDFVRYNLLKGDEEYKFIWTDKIERNITVTILMK